jgi:hypothetical protein
MGEVSLTIKTLTAEHRARNDVHLQCRIPVAKMTENCPKRVELGLGKLYIGLKGNHMTRLQLPHSAIVKSPGLLPMLYTVSEISAALDLAERTLRDWLSAGAPHFRDPCGHIWINGRECADWVATMRAKKKRKLRDDEAFWMRCNKAVQMTEVSTKPIQGKLMLIRGMCPNCGCTINRGGRLPTNSTNLVSAKEIPHAE